MVTVQDQPPPTLPILAACTHPSDLYTRARAHVCVRGVIPKLMYLPYSFDGLTVDDADDGIIIRMKVCLDTGESKLFSLSFDVESEVFKKNRYHPQG